MRRLALLCALSLVLAACGDCDCAAHKAPGAGTTATQAPAAPTEGGTYATASTTVEAAEPQPPVVAVAWRGAGTTLELSVWQMHCGGCEKRVEDALKGLTGIKDVSATSADSKVVVTLADASARESLKPLIRETLKGMDFRVLGE